MRTLAKLWCDVCHYFEKHKFSRSEMIYDYETGTTPDGIAQHYSCMACGTERMYGYEEPLVVV